MKNSYKEALDLALKESVEEPNNPTYVYPDIFGCWYVATFIGGAPVDFPFKAVCENGKILKEVE